MSNKAARSKDVKTPLARFAYARDLFKARAQEDGTEKFGCTLLFPKGDPLKSLKEAAFEAATLKWGADAEKFIREGLVKQPFLDGDGAQAINKKTKERHAGFAGHTFVRVSSGKDYPPRIVGPNRLDIAEADFYSGCYGYAVVNAVAWEHPKSGMGISFSISLAQKAKDGERLGGGGGADPDKFFDIIEDQGEAPESTKSGSGAAGLFG